MASGPASPLCLPTDLAAPLHGALRLTPWREHVKLVVVTPQGLAPTQPQAGLLPPLSNLSVQSMADFSRRLPAAEQLGQQQETATAGPGSSPPASHEGGEQRCFQQLFVCGSGFPGVGGAAPTEAYAAGQRVVQAVMRQQQQHPKKQLPVAAAQALGAAADMEPSSGQSRRLRIMFLKRGAGRGRQLLNAAELVARCNAWQYQPPNGSLTVTAECREVGVASALAVHPADIPLRLRARLFSCLCC